MTRRAMMTAAEVGLTGGPNSECRRDQACRRASPANELINSLEECGGVAAIFGDGRMSRFLRDTDLQQEAFLTVQDGTMSRERVVVVQCGTPQLRRGNRVRLGSHGGLFVIENSGHAAGDRYRRGGTAVKTPVSVQSVVTWVPPEDTDDIRADGRRRIAR